MLLVCVKGSLKTGTKTIVSFQMNIKFADSVHDLTLLYLKSLAKSYASMPSTLYHWQSFAHTFTPLSLMLYHIGTLFQNCLFMHLHSQHLNTLFSLFIIIALSNCLLYTIVYESSVIRINTFVLFFFYTLFFKVLFINNINVQF